MGQIEPRQSRGDQTKTHRPAVQRGSVLRLRAAPLRELNRLNGCHVRRGRRKRHWLRAPLSQALVVLPGLQVPGCLVRSPTLCWGIPGDMGVDPEENIVWGGVEPHAVESTLQSCHFPLGNGSGEQVLIPGDLQIALGGWPP